MKELIEIANRARQIALAGRRFQEFSSAATVKQRADSCLTDLLDACDRAKIPTDLHIPPIARATGAMLHTLIGFVDVTPGTTSNEWARTIDQQLRLVEAELDQFMEGTNGAA